ncbi:hypothetical protein [Streptomyces virginiae]|uniref:hypothetical protein n=1 Tax=Streptomyces virginiae TaxID=1961 RepID=UPI003702D91A
MPGAYAAASIQRAPRGGPGREQIPAHNYLLRTPKTGLWACTVPSGFTCTSTQNTLDCSTSGGLGTKYLLRAF